MAKTKSTPTAPPPKTEASLPRDYTVVARRYRPQQFSELIGQEHVAQALVNALQSGRVAHAYLFTGSRGVGKTSAARILAKCLNCVTGPTPTPCDACENCKAIAAGQDVDVLEIDGASNNKVEEIRDLRQGVSSRPMQSRYKIYIIDEVHMLTTSAFNALLKTLEEPPAHVKFILATTEVQKIPVTILSRCQRFDFANVGPGRIFEMLKRIVEKEGHEADDEALRVIARRASGSMRDSHSLLDQLLASTNGRLTRDVVHALLGSGGEERVNALAAAIVRRDPKAALDLLAAWLEQGLQVGELVDQMIAYWRSLMLVSCGGASVRELPVAGPEQKVAMVAQAKEISLDTILAGLEVWSATRARMRDSLLAPVVLEMAVVRLARMDDLVPISQLVQAIAQGGGVVAGGNRQATANVEGGGNLKKNELKAIEPAANGQANGSELSTLSFTESALPEIMERLIRYLSEKSPILANHLKFAILPAIFGPNSLAIRFPAGYNHACEACSTEGNIQRIRDALQRITGQSITIRLEMTTTPAPANGQNQAGAAAANPAVERRKWLMTLPLFRKAGDSLGAQIWHVDEDFNPEAQPPSAAATPNDDTEDEANDV